MTDDKIPVKEEISKDAEATHSRDLYARLIVDVNHSNLDRVFEYRIPENLRQSISLGQMVVVPFGRGNKPTEAFVIDISDILSYTSSQIKDISRVSDEIPVIWPDQIELAQWMAEEYSCLLVDALRLMIPAQLRGDGVRQKKLRIARLELNDLQRQDAIESLTAQSGRCKAPIQRDILKLFCDGQLEMSVPQICAMIPNANSAITAMAKKGWLSVFDEQVFRKPYAGLKHTSSDSFTPTDEQCAAIESVCQAVDRGAGNFILKGVTGSGKTEVYMRCISHCLEIGKTAIMLVPEISLTPQTVDRFRSRFGEDVAVLHSRLSIGERYDEWCRIRSGSVKVAVGARSAVFAPFEKLGLIVIDEEHESSYQSDKSPRYSAYDIAKKRCSMHNAPLLLGTATPSLEIWHKAKQGELDILTLDQRVNGKELPKIEIVDMRVELAQGNRSMFSLPLYRKMKECYFSGRQIILFLNRRGHSTFVSCRSCGHVLMCGSCDISLTYHKTDDTARCHYCGAQEAVPQACPACGKQTLKYFGAGTQQVEEQVIKHFPGIRTIRMDYDTTRTKDSHAKLLQAFRDNEADVLIGTQMIAKGLDFPDVTLVGVIAADASLHVPDFRNAERTFQILTQVAGRAGRDKEEGYVVIQTYTPEHPAIQFSSTHDFNAFYDYEIACRKQNEFPPFADFVRFLFTGDDQEKIKAVCDSFKKDLESRLQRLIDEECLNKDCLLYVTSHDAPLHFLRGEYRRQVLVKLKRTDDSEKLLRFIGAFVREKRSEGLMVTMEINPQNMT